MASTCALNNIGVAIAVKKLIELGLKAPFKI